MALAALSPSSLAPFSAIFSGYGPDRRFDEMLESNGRPHAHCRPLFEELHAASAADLSQRQLEADKAFLTRGITLHRLRRRAGHRADLSV